MKVAKNVFVGEDAEITATCPHCGEVTTIEESGEYECPYCHQDFSVDIGAASIFADVIEDAHSDEEEHSDEESGGGLMNALAGFAQIAQAKKAEKKTGLVKVVCPSCYRKHVRLDDEYRRGMPFTCEECGYKFEIEDKESIFTGRNIYKISTDEARGIVRLQTKEKEEQEELKRKKRADEYPREKLRLIDVTDVLDNCKIINRVLYVLSIIVAFIVCGSITNRGEGAVLGAVAVAIVGGIIVFMSNAVLTWMMFMAEKK